MRHWVDLKTYSPSVVLVAWAIWWIVLGRTLEVDVIFLVVLGVATFVHTREEIRRRRRGD